MTRVLECATMRGAAVAAVIVTAMLQMACRRAASPGETPERSSARQASARPQSESAEQEEGVEAEEDVAEKAAPATLPTECEGEGKPCLPPGEFVDRLCQGKFPSVAIVMFEKSTPWKRMYVRLTQGVDSMNTLGGPTSEARLVFGEEVLVLRQHGGGSGGIQVSGSGGYHALRWDGTCTTLSQDELVPYQPGVPRHAPFIWKYLEPGIQAALREDKQIQKARKVHRKECRGVSRGGGPACKRATKLLRNVVVLRVRKGLKLPLPEKLP